MVSKMILLLAFVDLVNHTGSSILARLMAPSELSAPSGGAPPEFSYIHLSQCKLQAVYCRERLHVTVFGKIANLSLGRDSSCTITLYCGGVSKYCCMEKMFGFVKSIEVSSTQFSSSIGLTVVKNTDCLPHLRLCPPGINPLLIIECTSLTFPMWQMYSVSPFGNSTLSCSSGSTALSQECP